MTFAFGRSNAIDIAFAVAIGVTAVAVLALARPPAEHTGAHRAIALLTAAAGAWTILVTLGIYDGETQRWIVFAGGAAVAALGFVAGLLHASGAERRTPSAA